MRNYKSGYNRYGARYQKERTKAVIAIIAIITCILAVSITCLLIVNKKSKLDKKEALEVSEEKKERPSETAKTKLVKNGLSTLINTANGSEEIDVKKYIEENVEPEDADFINEMLDKKVSISTVTILAEDFLNGGTITKSSIKKLISDMTPEEKEKFYEVAEKYGDDFREYIGR